MEKLLTGPDAHNKWIPALSNEWGRLAQGNDAGVQSTDTVEFVARSEVPATAAVIYTSFACNHRPLKIEEWRVCLVVGGDKLFYHGDTSSPATNMIETKILFNSVISDAKKGAQFASMDLKDMFLKTIMKTQE